MNSLDVNVLESMNHEYGEFDLIKEMNEGQKYTAVYECTSFLGHPVTVAESLEVDIKDDILVFSYTFRASVCGKGDPFDSETGLNIALGRIYSAENPDVVITCRMDSVTSLHKAIKDITFSKLDSLADYLKTKQSFEDDIKSREQFSHKLLSRKFEEFK